MRFLNRLFNRGRRYDDLSVSIEEHICERTEELMEEGMARKEAEQAARREFGNVVLMKERSREEWQWAAVESLLADLKLTLRRLRKSPGFAVTVLLALAIWSLCRFYYFAFYVIEKYVDSKYKFSGLIDFAKYVFRRRS